MTSTSNLELISAREAGRLMKVSHVAVMRWVKKNFLRGGRTPGGHMRIQKDDLLAFMRQREMPIPRRLLPRLSLLVIDDEATYVNALRQSLQRADARLVVDACSSGLDGLLRVGADMPDAVLVDALMPGVDGLDFCRIVKAHPRTRNIPVVGMSGRGAAYQDRFKAAGAAAFLEKPFTAKEVLEVLRRVGALPPREMVR